jgi:hypothetical protein
MRGLELHAPPLVRDLVCHDEERKVEGLRTIPRIDQGEPLLIVEGPRVGMHAPSMARTLDDFEGAIRVWTEMPSVVVQRGSNASDQALQILAVRRVMKNLDRDRLPSRRKGPLRFAHSYAAEKNAYSLLIGASAT